MFFPKENRILYLTHLNIVVKLIFCMVYCHTETKVSRSGATSEIFVKKLMSLANYKRRFRKIAILKEGLVQINPRFLNVILRKCKEIRSGHSFLRNVKCHVQFKINSK